MKAFAQIITSERNFAYLLSAVLLTLPLPYAFSSIAVIVLAVCSFASTFFQRRRDWRPYWIPVALYLLMVISLIWTWDLARSLRGLERQLPLLVIPLAFWMMPPLSKEAISGILRRFAIGLAGYAVLFLVVSVYRYFNGWSVLVFSYHWLVDLFDLNAIYISVMVSLSILFMVFYSKRSPLNILTTAILTGFLLLLSSKNVIAVTLLALLLGFLVTSKGVKRKWRYLLLGLLVVAPLLFFGPLQQRWADEQNTNMSEVLTKDTFGIFYPFTGTTIRLFQARMFYEMMEDRGSYLTGFGINAVQDLLAERQNIYDVYCGYNTYNFHNQYIQTLAELGIIGLILLLLLLASVFRDYRRTGEELYLFFFLVMVAVCISETYLWRQRGLIHFMLLFGLLAHLRSYLANDQRPTPE